MRSHATRRGYDQSEAPTISDCSVSAKWVRSPRGLVRVESGLRCWHQPQSDRPLKGLVHMFIEEAKCPECQTKGRPAAPFGITYAASGGYQLLCKCGYVFPDTDSKDQLVLSPWAIVRLRALSNHIEYGTVRVLPGSFSQIAFSRPFEYVGRVFLTPEASRPTIAKEASVTTEGMAIVAGRMTPSESDADINVSWLVYGQINVATLPAWHLQFYCAATHLANGLHKPALLDYAAAFELFLASYLREKLLARVGEPCTDFLLRRCWRVEERGNELLPLVVNAKFSGRADVYEPWREHVQRPRNLLAHGIEIDVDYDAAERAHQAVYQAIRWIESLK